MADYCFMSFLSFILKVSLGSSRPGNAPPIPPGMCTSSISSCNVHFLLERAFPPIHLLVLHLPLGGAVCQHYPNPTKGEEARRVIER